LHQKAHKQMEKKGYSKKTKNRVHRAICAITGHPVDIATGKVFTDAIDFELPGPIPLVWERVWFSTSDYSGNIGHGWHHNYDVSLGMDFEAKAAALRLADGRVEMLPFLEEDGSFMLKQEKISFFRKDNRFAYLDLDSGLIYWFATEAIREEGVFPLVKIENQYLQTIQFEYAANGALQKIIDSAGRILIVTTDKNKRIRSIKTQRPDNPEKLFSLIEYDYDGIGNLVATRDALGKGMTFQYTRHLLIQETDANGLSFYFKYEGKDISARCIHTWGQINL